MHITIFALGSRGDVQPYVALGAGLRQAGHHVRVVTFENFATMVTTQGLDFHPVKGDVQQLLNSSTTWFGSGQNILANIRGVRQTFGQLVTDYIESFSAATLRQTDAIINQLPGMLFVYDLAEALRVPHLVASVIPLVPTRAFPLSLLATHSLGGLLNRASYTLGQQIAWGMFRAGVQRFRRQLGLRPAPFFGYPDTLWQGQSTPVLHGFSRHVVPPPPDWGARVHVTGYWHLPESQWQPPPALVDFLAAGPPPVFVGFGSMPMPDPAATAHTVIAALEQSGQRGILARGWAQMSSADLPATIFPIDYVPYPWLFPRMAAVVHHGGSGTTGMGIWAGVPGIVVSFAADQPYWAQRLYDLGVGPRGIPFRQLTAARLAAAMTQAVSDARLRQQAARLGEQVRQEAGIAAAVTLIETYLQKW